MGTPVIELEGIEKVYASGEAETRALAGVSLRIDEGEFVAIIGASGSGKSTLLNVLGCLDRPSHGTYRLAGYETTQLDDDERAVLRNRLIGFVFQGYNLLARQSSLENTEVPLIYRGIRAREREQLSRAALELVGLGHRLDNQPTQLSGGQQQRVAIARALVAGPQVLFADEPTGNLDSRTTEEVLALLQRLNRERGLTIIMVTHEREVAQCASRIITVKDGLIATDVPNEPRLAKAPHDEAHHEGHTDELAHGLAPSPTVAAPPPRGSDLRVAWMSLRVALQAISRNKLRASLTVLGILIGVAAVITMSAIGAGAKERMESQLGMLGVNMLVVFPSSNTASGARVLARGLTEDDAAAIGREVPSVLAAAPAIGAGAQVVLGNRNASTRVTGTTPSFLEVRSWPIAEGAMFTDADVRIAAKTCIIGKTVRDKLFSPDEDPLGRTIRVGRMPCTVDGILSPKGQSSFGSDMDDIVVVPISTFRARISRRPGREVDTVYVSAREPRLVYRAEQAVNDLLTQRHRIGRDEEPDFTVRNLTDILKTFEVQRQAISMLLLIVASISLLVGGIGVMNIMLVSVTERTREIGIRLAIGARPRDVLLQFLVEAVTLASVGGLAGLALGVGASYAVGRLTEYRVFFEPGSALASLAVSCGIGVVFGFFPARSAANMDPMVALRRE